MGLTTITLQAGYPSLSPKFTCFQNPSPRIISKPIHSSAVSRRLASIAAVSTILLARGALFNIEKASAFDFRLTVPDQTPEEAQGVIRQHAEDLLEVKDILQSESWRDAQKALRKSSSLLKQDIYTLIQAKPGSERPQLRTLYSQLFNNVTRVSNQIGTTASELSKSFPLSLKGSFIFVCSLIMQLGVGMQLAARSFSIT